MLKFKDTFISRKRRPTLTKDTTIRTVEKFMNSQDMLMLRIKKGVFDDGAKNLDQILVPFEQFIEFLKSPENNLLNLLGTLTYNNILSYAQDGLSKCQRIYDTFFVVSSGLFGKKIKFIEPSQVDLEKAKSYYKDLTTINDKMNEYLKIGLQRLHSLDVDKFQG